MNATMTMDHLEGYYPSAGSSNTQDSASTTRPLWAAIGVLGICVLAMGASLVHIQQRPAEPTAQALAAPMKNFFSLGSAVPQSGDMITETREDDLKAKPVEAQKNAAQPATKMVAKPETKPLTTNTQPRTSAKQATANGEVAAVTPRAAQSPVANSTPAAPSAPAATPVAQAAPVCASCGTVEGVTPVTREGRGSGVGAVAGGVVGAVLGNQVGQGNGRTAATILGAVGGGWAGNTIEKKVKKVTVYDVRVRMQDGSTRHFEQAAAPAVGTKVTVDGTGLRGTDGTVFSQAAPAPQRAARTTPALAQQNTAYNTYSGGR